MAPVVTKTWREHRKFMKAKKWQKTEKYLQSMMKSKEENNIEETSNILTRAVPLLKSAPSMSIALPGSILDNKKTQEFRTYLAGQIARAACIYNISEVIIYDDTGNNMTDEDGNMTQSWSSCVQLSNILKYLDCPQYLRKHLFPMSDDFKYAGLLTPLDGPHHLRINDESPFREGVVTEKVSKSGSKSFADIGFEKQVKIDSLMTKNTRVTVRLHRSSKTNKLRGTVVPKDSPTKEEGLYWGYTVRLASRLSDVFLESPYGEYDYTLGTSDKGKQWTQLSVPKSGFKHGLIVFGGVKGLEFALSNDPKLEVDDVSLLFDAYLNTCQNQGARTIRTEEAVLISLSVLSHKLKFM